MAKKIVRLDAIDHRTAAEKQIRNDATPVYEKQEFPYPLEMKSAEEMRVWDWLTNVFRQTRNCRASDADINLMLLYCRAKVDYEKSDEACRHLSVDEFYVKYDTGREDINGNEIYQLKKNPLYEIRKEAYSVILKVGDELGLSPIGRARQGLAAANATTPDDILKSISRRNDDDDGEEA